VIIMTLWCVCLWYACGGCGGRPRFAGGDGVGSRYACAGGRDGVGGSRLGESCSYGCHCFCSGNLSLDILHERCGG
jgi:hypothetical protein